MRFLAFLLLTFSLNTHAAPPPESFDKLNGIFPDMTFVDPDGKQAKLSDYKGEVLVDKQLGRKRTEFQNKPSWINDSSFFSYSVS